MRLLMVCWFVCASIVLADTLETDPLTLELDQPLKVPSPYIPYIPPVDVRLELAQLNPQYALERVFDYDLMARDSQMIQAHAIRDNPFYGLKINEPLSLKHLSLFVLMNALDVYTTMEGTSYPCVVELNPLLSPKPSLEEMLLLKSLVGWLQLDQNLDGQVDITVQEINTITWITGVAVYNNYSVITDAVKQCPQ